MLSHHRLSVLSVGAGVLACLLASAIPAAAVLDGTTQPKFVNPLPIPGRIDMTEEGHWEMEMAETVQYLGLVDGGGAPLPTTVWGYGLLGQGTTYPGPTIVAQENERISIRFNNNLPPYNFPNGPGGHLVDVVDPTFHMAMPSTGVPTVVHLHGGHTESASDGLPESWFTQGFAETGPHFVQETMVYDNDQDAATLWYHDHVLGITRLNVYAGLAGFYLLRDRTEEKLIRKRILPGDPYEIEIVIQDHMFNDDGSHFFPSEDPELMDADDFASVDEFLPLPPGPSGIAEFFGDIILVNGAPWPVLHVEPRKYRLRFLNGSDSRFYILEARGEQFGPGPAYPFLVVGTDQGRLDYALEQNQLIIAPGERYDVVVDFTYSPPGAEIFVRNFGGDEPFKGFNPDGSISDGEGGVVPPADENSTGQVMKFVVDVPRSSVKNAKVEAGTKLNKRLIEPLVQDGPTRELVLFEGADEYGRLQPMLGTLAEGSLTWHDEITESPLEDDTEVWEIYNTTADAHPIHLHLVKFQLLDRQSFTGNVSEKVQHQHNGEEGVGGILAVTSLGGDTRGPDAREMGWKDTVIMYPGEVTRVIATFDRDGRYVWHCHILSHEDHDMMRAFYVRDRSDWEDGQKTARGSDLGDQPMVVATTSGFTAGINGLSRNGLEISLDLPRADRVDVAIFNVLGQEVRSLGSKTYAAGNSTVLWDGRDNSGAKAPSGVYFFKIATPTKTVTKKGVMVR